MASHAAYSGARQSVLHGEQRHGHIEPLFCCGRDAGMRSWVGDDPATWLAPRWGDVYLHETAISHIRRLLDTRFTCCHPNETAKQFGKRLRAVQDYMNSESFAAQGRAGRLG